MRGREEEESSGGQALSLGGSGETHPVVAHAVDRIVGPEEDVPEDSQGLAILGGQVEWNLEPSSSHVVTIKWDSVGKVLRTAADPASFQRREFRINEWGK